MCYIVAAVVISDGKLLMTREGFEPCRGQWYLPAGRLDPNETLEEGAQREVREETGMEVELLSLLCVESPYPRWFRFTFTAECVGGKLRTLAEQDSETMEAGWIPVEQIYTGKLNLRSHDILPLIKLGEKWYKKDQEKEFYIMPVKNPHSNVVIRVLLVKVNNDCLEVFIGKERKAYTEAIEREGRLDLPSFVERIVFSSGYRGEIKVAGVLSVEHTGDKRGQTDGILFTILVEATGKHSQSSSSEHWLKISDKELKAKIRHVVENNSCVPISKH